MTKLSSMRNFVLFAKSTPKISSRIPNMGAIRFDLQVTYDKMRSLLKNLSPCVLFSYHVKNACYKGYTNSTKIAKLKEQEI